MLKIRTTSGYLDVPKGFTVQIDEQSPVMNDRGSQTVPVTLPYTPRNAAMLGYAHRLDVGNSPMAGRDACQLSDGAYLRSGKINLVSASARDGFTINIGFDNSEAFSAWKAKKLQKLGNLPVVSFSSAAALCSHLQRVLNGTTADYAVFQVVVANECKEENKVKTYYPLYLNRIFYNSGTGRPGLDSEMPISNQWHREFLIYSQARRERQLMNGEPTDINLPEGYGVTPFLYVWRVVELIFEEYGFTLKSNPFKDDPRLKRLVVLNNAADCCCKGVLKYADLMPTCTVDDFLSALWGRFGATYICNSDTRTAEIRLVRDIIAQAPAFDITEDVVAPPLISYETPKQLKLSSSTSFTDAAPVSETYEEFIKDFGDPYSVVRSGSGYGTGAIDYERTTGRFYKFDNENQLWQFVGSGAFSWDMQTDGCDSEDITSPDEYVPMDYAQNGVLCPQYLAGYVHRTTYISQSSVEDPEDDSKDNETPLAFCFAYMMPDNSYPFGSSLPYTSAGEPVTFGQEEHGLSMLYQFPDGLFAKFWAAYDAVLRHSYRKIESKARLALSKLSRVNLLDVVGISGQLCIWDQFTHTMPSADGAPLVELTLRTLRLLPPYDLKKEQRVAVISGGMTLVWEFDGDWMQEMYAAISSAVTEWEISTRCWVRSTSEQLDHEPDYADAYAIRPPSSYHDTLQVPFTVDVIMSCYNEWTHDEWNETLHVDFYVSFHAET